MIMEDHKIPTNQLSLAAQTLFDLARENIRKPYKYDDTYHPDIIMFWAVQGKSITTTCTKIGIARCTYYTWINEHALFSKAAKTASTLRQAFFDEMLVNNINERDFNFLAFESNYRRLFHYSDQAKVELDPAYGTASNKERVELVQQGLADQKLDPIQASTIIASIKAASDIIELDDVRDQMELLKNKLEQ